MKFSPIDHLALQLGLCSVLVAVNGFVVRPAPNANAHRHGSKMPRRGGDGAARAGVFRQHTLTMKIASENNDGLDLDPYSTPQELSDAVSDQTLQNALDAIGLKSNEGASPLDKAKLLFLTKYLPLEDIPEKYWAEPKGGREGSTSDASTDMAAENVSIGEDDGSEDAASIETSTSSGAIGKADGSGNSTDVDTAMSSEVDEPPAPLSETEDSTDDSASGEGFDLDLYDSYQELCEAYSDDVLRAELQRIGLKSDGTLMDMAKRLFITKYFPIDQIPEEYLEASSGAADTKGGDVGQEEAVLEASAEDTELVTEAADDDDECVDDNDDEKDDDDEVERLEEEQRLLEMELEAVEARIGETVETDPVASTPDVSTEVNEVVEKDEQSLQEPERTKTSKATDLTEKKSQTDVPAFPAANGNAQAAAAAVKEETERQRLEVERIKAERIAAEEEAAAIRREKERIAAQEEMEADEQDDEGSAIDTDEAKSIVEEDEDVLLDQALPEAVSESFEMGGDEDQPVEREKRDEMSNPFDSKGLGASLPPSSTLPSSNPFIAEMPPSSTLPSSNPFIAGPSKEKSSEDDAPSDDEESVSNMPSSPAFYSPNPFTNPPSQENDNKENSPTKEEEEEEEEPKESGFRFEAERIKAEQEAKRQELARERLEAEALASQSKDVDTKEKSSEPSLLSRVASAAAGTIGLGVLAVGGSLFLDGSGSGNENQSVPSPPIAEVISSTDTSKGVPRASIGESERFSSEKVEDSSKSSATDSPLVDERDTLAGDSSLTAPEAETKLEAETLQHESSNEDTTAASSISTSEGESKDDVPATESSSVSSSDAESKQELEILRSERDNEGAAAAAVPSSTSDSQSKDDVPAAESSSLGSSESEANPEPKAVTADTVKGDGDTSSKATTLINASEESPTASPPSSPPAPPKQQQQQEPTKPVEIVVSKPESTSTAPIVKNIGKVFSGDSPSIELPAFKVPSIDGIFPSTEKIKQTVSGIASGIDVSNGAKIAGVTAVAALGAIGLAMQGKDEASPGKNSGGAGIKIEDIGPGLKETNSTVFELPTQPQATNKTSASMPFPAKNMTAQNVILNAKEVNGSSTKPPFDSSKSPVPSSTRPVSPDQTDKKSPASTSPRPQAFVAASPGPKRVIKPIDAEIISSKKDADSDKSLQRVLDEASEAVASTEAALRNATETGSNSTSSAKMDTIESEEDKRIAAEFKAAKEKMEAEKLERIEKAKSAEAQFLDQERKEAAEKAKQKRAEAEKRIADARDTIRLEQARDQKAAVPNPDEKPTAGAPSGASATTNGATSKAFVPQSSSQRAVSPRPSAAEATPRQSGNNNWFNEQLRRQQMEEKTGPSAFERSRKLADGTEIPPDPRAAYKSSSYYGTNVDAADGVLSTVEYAKSAFLAAFVGIWAAFPILGLHYLVFSDYAYTTFAQWEWELIAASVQSSCFGIIYRYAMRSDVNNSSLQRIVVLAAVLLKSVIRVIVPNTDSAPFFVWNDSMTTDLLLNGLEGLAMFTAVAVSMNWLSERRGR